MNSSLISECEKLAEELFNNFVNTIDEKTHSFREYELAYRLALDQLEYYLKRSAP